MSILRRMSDLIQGKVNAALNQAEDPAEAMDLSYAKQLEVLQQVRRNVADVLTSEKRLEIQAAQLRQSQGRLQQQAQAALAQGREDLARMALTRAQTAQTQLDALGPQIDQLKDQEQKLEVLAQKLQAKVESFRTQKETIKAQYSAAEASTKIGEAVTGLSEQMADVSMMVDRAQEKTSRMQARAEAVNQLVDTGALDQIGPGNDDIERQLLDAGNTASVEAQLQAMKQQLALPSSTTVVRIQGDDQFRLSQEDRQQLDKFDHDLMAAINADDEAGFRSTLATTLEFVRSRGVRLGNDQMVKSDLMLPSDDMTLQDAKGVLAGSSKD